MNALWGVVPAAGSGQRMASELPKQYLEIAGRPLLDHALQALLGCADVRGVMVALAPDDPHTGKVPSLNDPRVATVAGGAERADSVLAALRALSAMAAPDDWVLVHDAARPCLAGEDLMALIAAVVECDCGGLLAQPVNDTVKRVDGDLKVMDTVDRRTLWRAQTPQMFRLADLSDALERMQGQGELVTDESSAMEQAGYQVQVIPGSARNLKVTVPEDLMIAEYYLKANEESSP